MPQLSGHTPFGDITLTAENNALVSLDWGWAPLDQQETPLLFEAWRALNRYFDGDPTPFDLPLNPAGTRFQLRVWTQLRGIPFGRVETYGAIADAVCSAPRAVGGACGLNPLPIIIPCHRVVAANGSLGGYSGDGGLETKRALLALEGAAA
ncbi:MAG: methylated-DNA--[protein]-cysteine S-methyltransferase [Sphingomonadales bacterium]